MKNTFKDFQRKDTGDGRKSNRLLSRAEKTLQDTINVLSLVESKNDSKGNLFKRREAIDILSSPDAPSKRFPKEASAFAKCKENIDYASALSMPLKTPKHKGTRKHP